MSDFATVVSRATITSAHENAKIDHAFEKLDDYIIRREGTSDYDVIYGGGSNQAGKIAQNKTGLVAAIQWAHDQLTAGGCIGVKHGASWGKSWEQGLLISNKGITLHSISLRMDTGIADGFGFQLIDSFPDDYAIRITGVKTKIYDLVLDGNKANNASKPVYGFHDQVGSSSDLHISHVYMVNFKNTGFYDQGGAGYWEGVYSEYNDNYGFIISSTRNIFVQCGAYACERGWQLTDSCERNRFFGCIAAQSSHASYGWGWLLDRSHKNKLFGCEAHLNKKHGFYLWGAQRNTLMGCHSFDNSQVLNNDSDGFLLASNGANHCLRNQFLGCQIWNDQAKKQRYGIYEADANQDRNIIANCIVTDNVTDQILTQGVNSVEDNNIEA